MGIVTVALAVLNPWLVVQLKLIFFSCSGNADTGITDYNNRTVLPEYTDHVNQLESEPFYYRTLPC